MNTLNSRTVALGLALMTGAVSHAQGVDAGPFLKVCEAALRKPVQATDTFQSGYCMGMLDASFGALVLEAAEARRTDNGLCPKADSRDPLTLVKVVVQYLKANPQTHAEPAEVPIRAALRKAFPCR